MGQEDLQRYSAKRAAARVVLEVKQMILGAGMALGLTFRDRDAPERVVLRGIMKALDAALAELERPVPMAGEERRTG
jgi:hypothetical protein